MVVDGEGRYIVEQGSGDGGFVVVVVEKWAESVGIVVWEFGEE